MTPTCQVDRRNQLPCWLAENPGTFDLISVDTPAQHTDTLADAAKLAVIAVIVTNRPTQRTLWPPGPYGVCSRRHRVCDTFDAHTVPVASIIGSLYIGSELGTVGDAPTAIYT
jgi:hypothetical protein